MTETSHILLTLGGLLLAGLAMDAIGRLTALPRVTLLLLFGFVIGPSVLDVLPPASTHWFSLVADVALLMIGFLLGEKLAFMLIGEGRKPTLVVSLSLLVATIAVVFVGLLLLQVPLVMALLLAGIATATAPAAISDVIAEVKAKGPFSRLLLGVVAIDDAWGLIAFSFLLAASLAIQGQGGSLDALLNGMYDLGGAVALGAVLGAPMAYLAGRIRPGEPSLAEALGMVFLCGGLAQWLEVSFLLAAMVMGMTVARFSHHYKRPFHAIAHIEWPFMILFFVLAGSALHLEAMQSVGIIGVAYIVLRIIARFVGVWMAGPCCGMDRLAYRWLAPALLPQAGVAIGMALVAAQRFPQYADQILVVVVGATVFFELVGPVLTRMALIRMGEANGVK